MKLDTKKILMVAVVAISLLVVGCAEDDQKDIDNRQPLAPQVQPNPFFNNGQFNNGQFGNYGPNFYDYQAVDCNAGNQFSGSLQTNYSNLGLFLSGNPDSSQLLRYGNQCYYARDVYNMYSRYHQGRNPIPWNDFQSSPYNGFQMHNAGTSGGQYRYNQTTNVQYDWRGTDQGMYGYPGYDNQSPQWNIEFGLWW